MISKRPFGPLVMFAFLGVLCLGLYGCPECPTCPTCPTGEGEGEGEAETFSLIGHWIDPSFRFPGNETDYRLDFDFLADNRYSFGVRPRYGYGILGHESGTYVYKPNAVPRSLDLQPDEAEYPWASEAESLIINLGVVEWYDNNRVSLGFAGNRSAWGATRPLGLSVSDLVFELRREAKANATPTWWEFFKALIR